VGKEVIVEVVEFFSPNLENWMNNTFRIILKVSQPLWDSCLKRTPRSSSRIGGGLLCSFQQRIDTMFRRIFHIYNSPLDFKITKNCFKCE